MNEQLKPFKSVEAIAKKHRLEVSFIQKQLDMGEPIEHEHTKNHELAREIALQHLDEIPDYYTRLKKMEADAKKHHKKFKDVSEESKSGDEGLHDWFNKSKSSDDKKGWVQLGGKYAGKPCARQPGQTSTPKCGSSKMKRALSKDEEDAAKRRKNRLDPNQPEKTGGAKPTNVRTEEMDLQEVKDKPGKGSGKKDACYNKVKSRYNVWPSAYASGALVKCRKVGAANWGTKSEAVENEEQRYCPLCDKRETRSECSYGEKAWDKVSIKDEEYSMARSELKTIIDAAKKLQQKVGKGEGSLEAWVQSKITKAADYIDTASDYVNSGEMREAKTFGFEIRKSSGAGALTPDAAKQLGPKAVQLQKKKASAVDLPKIRKEHKGIVADILQEIEEEDSCWNGYKKVGMKKKGNKIVPNCVPVKEENDNICPYCGCDPCECEEIEHYDDQEQIKESVRLPAVNGNIIEIMISWRGKTYVSKMFFPQTKVPNRREVTDQIIKVYPGSKVLAFKVSGLEPGQPIIQIQNSQSKNYLLNNKNIGEEVEVEIEEDWQSVNRKDKTDGLSQKAVNAYRRENPGSKLQTAVTEKNPTGKRAQRRKNFCSRMSGMKKRLTSAETARDPDSRINKALRRWNCN
jgi:hypothetical protein